MCAGDHDNRVKPSLFSTVINAKDGSALMTSDEIERMVQQEDKREAELEAKQVSYILHIKY